MAEARSDVKQNARWPDENFCLLCTKQFATIRYRRRNLSLFCAIDTFIFLIDDRPIV